jgi:hypothetical protein
MRKIGILIHLNKEHGFRRDLHVMAKLEVRKEGNSLRHAHVAVNLEADIGNGITRPYKSHGILSDHVQTRRLYITLKIFSFIVTDIIATVQYRKRNTLQTMS